MFSVILEVQPRRGQWEAYLESTRLLRPELEQVEGFIGHIRYRSLTCEGRMLSLSDWRDEKALVRRRTAMRHHDIQEKGRSGILRDYHLRVGQVTADTQVPAGYVLEEQRLDETEAGDGTSIVLITDERPAEWGGTCNAPDCAQWLGLDPCAPEMVSWDVFEAALARGDLLLMMVFRHRAAAGHFTDTVLLKRTARLRQIRVIRDYGMLDRREAPQYFPEQQRR